MPQYSAHVIHQGDSSLPRDQSVNVLHFNDHGPLTDPDNLASDLADVFTGVWDTNPAGRKVTVKIYDMGQAIPREVKGEATSGTVDNASSTIPREIALCLSFYASRNLPRSRGRIYLPVFAHGSAIDRRPSDAYLASALQLAQGFADLGGPDVDWIVRSTVGDPSQPVTDAWCDDEWDTVRSRGLRATKRQTLHTGS